MHARRLSIARVAVFSCAAPARADTTTFVFTGTEQVFPVPAGVTSLHVVAIGGRVKLTARRALPAGTYALRAVRGSREQRVAVSVRRR